MTHRARRFSAKFRNAVASQRASVDSHRSILARGTKATCFGTPEVRKKQVGHNESLLYPNWTVDIIQVDGYLDFFNTHETRRESISTIYV